MPIYAVHSTFNLSATERRNRNTFQLHQECEKLEAMADKCLEQGKSLSSHCLLRQSALIDELIVEEMLLSEVAEK